MDALCLYRCRDGVAISFCIGEARLTDLAPPPVEIIALEADPVTRLVLDRSPVARVENGRLWNTRQVTGTNLALLGEGFVVWPIQDTGSKGIAGDVLDLSTDGKGTA